MRIGIDARFWDSTWQGIDRYTGEIIMHLGKFDRKNTYCIFARNDAHIPKLPMNFHLVRVSYRWYGFSEQITWPLLLRKYKLDLMHFTHFNVPLLYRQPFVVTIHDLILLHSRGTHLSTLNPAFFAAKYAVYKVVLSSAVRRASKIITISQYSRKDIERYYPAIRDKITVIYNGITSGEGITDDVARSFTFPQKFALYVGNAYPHKNLDFLLKEFHAWAQDHRDCDLVLIGKRDAFYASLEQRYPSDKYKHFHFTGLVDDATLMRAYREARLFIMPSLHEGFGMPVLEAMSAGTAVLAAQAGATPEIAGDGALYFEPHNSQDFQTKLSIAFNDVKTRDVLRERGYKRVQLFSWMKAAQQHHALYSEFKNQYNA